MTSSSQLLINALEKPRAVAIVLGHLGATQSQLESYAKWYSDRGCSTIAASSPFGRFALNLSLKCTANLVIQEAAVQLGKPTNPPLPLVIHSMSNGGAFILEEMELLLQEQKGKDANEGILLVARRLQTGFQLFDSCPCFVRMLWQTDGFGNAFPNKKWSSVGRTAYTLGASTSLTLWCAFTFSMHKPQRFWNRMVSSDACSHQIYIYTTADMASDAAQMDKLIKQRQDKGVDCTVLRYDDSDHCQLLRDHPEDYGHAIDDALDAAVSRAENEAE